MVKALHVILLGLVAFFAGCESASLQDVSTKPSAYNRVLSKVGTEAMVLELGASSCASCVRMKALIDTLKSQDPTLPLHLIDVIEHKEAIARFSIQMIPTQVVLDAQGKEIFRHVGELSEEGLRDLITMAKGN